MRGGERERERERQRDPERQTEKEKDRPVSNPKLSHVCFTLGFVCC